APAILGSLVARAVVVGVAVERGVVHGAYGARGRDVLGELVVRLEGPGAGGLEEELDARAHHVGEGLVERSRLPGPAQPRRELGDAVRELVPDHVQGGGEGLEVLASGEDARGQAFAE